MNIVELIEISLATLDQRRVEITAIEPAEVAKGAVGGLTQLVAELVDNAMAFSGPEERVTITGVFERGDYVISISDNGAGIPDPLIAALNAVLSDPTSAVGQTVSTPGIATVARLAARNAISVRLVPSVPGTTARITIPGRLVDPEDAPPSPDAAETKPTELTRIDTDFEPGHVAASNESLRAEAEAFLEKVFGPLRGQTVSKRPPKQAKSNGNGALTATPAPPAPNREPTLQTRIPGENFHVEEDDPSVMGGEAAVDIRLNLSKYDEGRRAAADSDPRDEVPRDL